MAVSSPLNPSTIVRERPTTAAAAQNFITGGSPLGEGVVASAANKIVGFQRGAAAVAARPPDLNSIIQTLSSNILNNVENRVQSINQNVTQIVNKTLGELGTDYKDRLGKIDAARPNSILQNFLSLYKQALEYIQFLGNRRNVKTLGDNLKSLQNIFSETFNVARIIRQTIVRIVKQLSSLPAATSGGGGLNLDIDIPGGSLRKGPMSGISRMMRRRPGMMLGGAALAGGLGTQVVSGLLDIGGDVQAAPMSEGTIPGVLLDRFNSILDRFSSAINSLSNIRRDRPSSGGGGGGAAPPPPEDKKPPGGGGAPVVSSGSAGENIAAFTSTLEATGAQNQADVMQVMINRAARNHSGYGDLFGQVTAREQFSPISAAIYVESADKNAQRIYGPIAAKLGRNPQERIAKLREIAEGPNGLENLRKLFGKGDPASASKVLEDFKTQGVMSQTSAKDIGGGLYFRGRSYTGGGVYFDRGSNRFIGGKGKGPATLAQVSKETPTTVAAPTKPSVTAAPTQATNAQQVAQSVSRPPVQQTSQITVAPMDMSSPQTQSTKMGDKVMPPPVVNKGGSSVPFLTSSNHDNFLTLYSKLVYNIVDG